MIDLYVHVNVGLRVNRDVKANNMGYEVVIIDHVVIIIGHIVAEVRESECRVKG